MRSSSTDVDTTEKTLFPGLDWVGRVALGDRVGGWFLLSIRIGLSQSITSKIVTQLLIDMVLVT